VTRSAEEEIMDCLKCENLKVSLKFRLNEYVEARASAYYQVSTEIADFSTTIAESSGFSLPTRLSSVGPQ
jgi:hypothetical protein